MTSKSKAKGSSFEREVAKYLSDMYGESFIRNISGSGAYVGGSNVHRKSTLTNNQILSTRGDIHCPESFSNLNIECKSYSDFSWHLLFEESKQLESWIEQLITVGDKNSLNLLCFKITRRGRYVAVQGHIDWNVNNNYFVYNSKKHGNWFVMSFESFFETNQEKIKLLSSENQTENSNQKSVREALHPVTPSLATL